MATNPKETLRSAMFGESQIPLNERNLRECLNNEIRMDNQNKLRLRAVRKFIFVVFWFVKAYPRAVSYGGVITINAIRLDSSNIGVEIICSQHQAQYIHVSEGAATG
ncbi:hypothetical protein SERLA73DRAFT_178514 [Serpula lacrymans var. lacrymans S7.3]|uniref:Uncharacterized protein n=1 Tax=Serpula lacrymans var. lacrymans (strain S7.3) TaxID=936435 RepID=F8PRS5_SERL3|nr:hypothetical protein SERLA73DRAFT_178514 [Serpula lacrymans var. lacrymans S7.3]